MFSHAYNLNLELEKAKKARLSGKKVMLIIGRGSKQGLKEQDHEGIHCCFLSPLRENFLLKSESTYSEFITTLNKLPIAEASHLFDEIVVDGGTLHHLVQELQKDELLTVPSLTLATEIRFGDFFDVERVAGTPIPMIYAINPQLLAFHELLLERLRRLSYKELNLFFPCGEEEPWTLKAMERVARMLEYNPEAQIKELTLFTWYLMSRKECKLFINRVGKEAPFLPKNAEIKDKDSYDESGSEMFKGFWAGSTLPGVDREFKDKVKSTFKL